MTVPLRPRLTVGDKNVAVVVGTLVPQGVTAAESKVDILVSLVGAEAKSSRGTNGSDKKRRVSRSNRSHERETPIIWARTR